MIINSQILIFAVMITISFAVVAEEIYEKVDKEGVVEYSDMPSFDAQAIQLEKPNVADTLPVERVEPTSPASTTTTKIEQSPEPLEVIYQGTADDHDDIEERMGKRENIKERMENVKEGAHQPEQLPAHKGVRRK